MKSHQFSFYRVLSQRGRCQHQQNQNQQRQNITQDTHSLIFRWMCISFITWDKVLLFLVDIIYLFVLVLAGEECNSGNYYQFTPRGNTHLGHCNPQAAPTQQMQSAHAPSPSLSSPSSPDAALCLMSTIRRCFVNCNKLSLREKYSLTQDNTELD